MRRSVAAGQHKRLILGDQNLGVRGSELSRLCRALAIALVSLAVVPASSCGSNCLGLGTAGKVCGERETTLPIVNAGNGGPVVAGSADGAAVHLLLDSGSNRTILSATLLGAKPDANYVVKSLCLGSICLEGATVWARDSGFSSPDMGVGAINGLVGMDVLAASLVEIDHGQTVKISQTAAACAGATVAISLDDYGRPVAPASVDGRDLGAILIDTGALYSLFSATTAATIPYLAETAVAATGCGINGCTDDQFTSRAHQLCVGTGVGNRCLNDLPVKYPAWDAIGDSLLFQYRVDLDFPRRQIVFCDP